MQNYGLNELREKFLQFFEDKGHLRAASFPLVPKGDNSLLFINSGMAPLKPYFSGEATPPRKRMTTCQKCVRTPDIENVGRTSRHGTFFEMLGNFSFGDYFKREAAPWAWEFVTKTLGIPEDLIYISVFAGEGDSPADTEAYDIWTKEVGVRPERMVKLGKKDNFWEIGSGPCGPCSEIYFDRGEENGCGDPNCAPGCDCDRYVEFWNLVFTQFNNDGNDNYSPLAQKNIDTGMGLERLACIMQNVDNLFEVDTIQEILKTAAKMANKTYKSNEKDDISLRVVTDHIRSVTMMVCDGALPSNEGRGYVLRRLLRRAARHGRLLGISGTFLHELCLTVIEESGGAYPELRERRDYIQRVIKVEEERFEQTIDAGMKLLQDNLDNVTGAFAFKLYDTYGFPVELTEEILADNGKTLDRAEFDALLLEQRNRARAARATLGDTGWDALKLDIDKSVQTRFTGYDHLHTHSTVLASFPDMLVLDVTPFYAEMGGQVADHGVIEGDMGVMQVRDVRKTKDGQYIHIGEIEGEIPAGAAICAKVDGVRRAAIERAHSATHLLHRALREILGTHVEQAGSFVEPDRLRFDFTHFSAMTAEELSRVVKLVGDSIYAGLDVDVSEKTVEEAKAGGAIALFGEKYGDTVRVVDMGGGYSVELCGGTHVINTAQVGLFAVQGGDASVAAGVRRIEAHVGRLAASDALEREKELKSKLEQSREENKALRKQLSGALQRSAFAEAETALEGQILVTRIDGDGEILRGVGDMLRDKYPGIAAVIASVSDGKITFFAVCGKLAVEKGIKAGELIKLVSAETGGSGGGRPDSAMGGGKNPGKLESALNKAKEFIKSKIGG
ncbi:alanine--tRNA ligase [Clostridia bacterium]|nr:alanine--tRNA ligase [Clostridia bacterium]